MVKPMIFSLTTVVWSLFAVANVMSDRDAARERLANEIAAHVDKAVGVIAPQRQKALDNLPDFSLVRTGEWTEIWPSGMGRGTVTNVVRGEIWTDAIQATLDAKGSVWLPARTQPYYLDGPIVLASGQTLVADPYAEFRLKPGVNMCMVRNKTVVGCERKNFVIPDVPYDRDVYVEGGIWTTLQTMRGVDNGNAWGYPMKKDPPVGCYGAMVFNHVRGLAVRNVTIRRCHMHGIQLSDVHDYLVDGVTFQEQGRDGVHQHGCCDWGVVRNVRGDTYDDLIAVNAWDWIHTSPALGPIHHLLVERIVCNAHKPGEGANGTRDIRLLPGNKRRADGSACACPISDVVVRDCSNFHHLKLYDQPNLEIGRDNDRSEPIGTFCNVYFHRLRFDLDTTMQVADMVDGLDVSDVVFTYPRTQPFVRIAPMSATWKTKPTDPSTWVEIFSPDESFTVKGFSLRNVRTEIGGVVTPLDPKSMYVVQDGTLNPDYPKTTPRGGTGKVTMED